MKQRTRFTTALVIAALTLGMVSSAAADVSDDAEGNATVTVQVATKIAVDVTPEQLEYGSFDPGESKAFATNGPSPGYGSIEIENIGSENISQVWLNASVPTERPFGTGTAASYDAGNFIKVKPDDSTAQRTDSYFTFVNRKEWNESSPLRYVFTPDGEDWDYGRFRAGENEFFWAVEKTGTPPNCAENADSFRLGNDAHNESFTGSTDFTTASDYSGKQPTQVGTTDKYVVTDVTPDIPGQATEPSYDVVLECDNANGETTATFTRYNVKADGVNDLVEQGGITQHLINSSATNTDAMLQPGENVAVNTSVQVPQGVVSNTGSGYSGTLRVFVNSLVT